MARRTFGRFSFRITLNHLEGTPSSIALPELSIVCHRLHVSQRAIPAARVISIFCGERSERLDENPVELFRLVVNVTRDPMRELDLRRVDVRVQENIARHTAMKAARRGLVPVVEP